MKKKISIKINKEIKLERRVLQLKYFLKRKDVDWIIDTFQIKAMKNNVIINPICESDFIKKKIIIMAIDEPEDTYHL